LETQLNTFGDQVFGVVRLHIQS